MPKEPGEPDVVVRLLEEGVEVQFRALLRGDDTDWHPDLSGTWMSELWEGARHVAKLHHRFGIKLEGALPTFRVAAPIIVEAPPDDDEQDATIQEIPRVDVGAVFALERPEPATDLPHSRLARVEEIALQNGGSEERPFDAGKPEKTAPRMSREEMARVDDAILQALQAGPPSGIGLERLRTMIPGATPSQVHFRCWTMKQQGLVEHVRTGLGIGGGYVLPQGSPRESETEAPLAPRDSHLEQVRVFTRGRIAVMIGGDPQPPKVSAIAKALDLEELRWPQFDEADPMAWRLNLIRRPEVGLVFINRWNRRYSRHYQHAARERGIPVVLLPAGLNPDQVVEQCHRQIVTHRGGQVPLGSQPDHGHRLITGAAV